MEIGIGILAFLVYIIFVMAWYLLLKRSIAEAMLLGLIIVCAFNGVGTLPQTFAASLTKALKQDVMAAIILFTVMASIMTQTGIITRLVNILNSILGRFRGGPALCIRLCQRYVRNGIRSQQRQRRHSGLNHHPLG